MISRELKDLLSYFIEGIILFDIQGKIIVANPHAALLLDSTSKELKNQHIDKIFKIYQNDQELGPARKIFYTIFKKKKLFFSPLTNTFYLKINSSRKFPIFISGRKIKIDKKMMGIVMFRDITTEKKLETRIRELEEIYKLTIGRESKVMELNEEIKKLREELQDKKIF